MSLATDGAAENFMLSKNEMKRISYDMSATTGNGSSRIVHMFVEYELFSMR